MRKGNGILQVSSLNSDVTHEAGMISSEKHFAYLSFERNLNSFSDLHLAAFFNDEGTACCSLMKMRNEDQDSRAYRAS